MDRLDAEDGLRCAILTGAGGSFCSGMDLKAFLRGEVTRVEGRGILGIARTPPKKPLIAAVEGYCLAGGFESMLCCDLVVAARKIRVVGYTWPLLRGMGVYVAYYGNTPKLQRISDFVAWENNDDGTIPPVELVIGEKPLPRIQDQFGSEID